MPEIADAPLMPGPLTMGTGEKRCSDVISNAVRVMQIATGQIEDTRAEIARGTTAATWLRSTRLVQIRADQFGGKDGSGYGCWYLG